MAHYVVVDMGSQLASIDHASEWRWWSNVQKSGTEQKIKMDGHWQFAPDSKWEPVPPNSFRRKVVRRG